MALDSLDRWLFGTVRAPLSCLSFPRSSGARLASRQNVEQKLRLFREPLCAPHVYDNQIIIAINDATRKKILSVLQVSPDQLRDPRLVFSLKSDFKFLCQDGRSRIEAARRLYGGSFEWTLRLYCAPPQPDQQIEFNHLFTRKCDSFNFQVPFSDGEIYRNIRTMPIDDHDWVSRLSKCKKPILKALLHHDQLTNALDNLLCFPGLWRGLQLGNIHKHIALHWDEELGNYLRYVFDTWDTITNGQDALRQAVDVDTVRSLQYRIPSGIDAFEIRDLFQRRELFPDVVDSDTRSALEERVLGLQYFVPSLETFHRDTMHFSVAVKAVKKWIAPDFDASDPGLTLRKILARDFQPTAMWQEQSGGQWMKANGVTTDDPENAFTFAYRQLILAALRSFAELGYESPTQEHGKRVQGCIKKGCVDHLRTTAQTLGFLTPKALGIEFSNATPATASSNSLPARPPQPCMLSHEVATYRRTWKGGRPPTSVYFYLQSHLFDGNIVEAGPPSFQELPSVIFIQKCVIFAFFGGYPSYHNVDVHMKDVMDDPVQTKSRGSHLMEASDYDVPYPSEGPKNPTQIKPEKTSEVGGRQDFDGHRSVLAAEDIDMVYTTPEEDVQDSKEESQTKPEKSSVGQDFDGHRSALLDDIDMVNTTHPDQHDTQDIKQEISIKLEKDWEVGNGIDLDGHRSTLLAETNVNMADAPQHWHTTKSSSEKNKATQSDHRVKTEEQDLDGRRPSFMNKPGIHQADAKENVPTKWMKEIEEEKHEEKSNKIDDIVAQFNTQENNIWPKVPSHHDTNDVNVDLDSSVVTDDRLVRVSSIKIKGVRRESSIKCGMENIEAKCGSQLEAHHTLRNVKSPDMLKDAQDGESNVFHHHCVPTGQSKPEEKTNNTAHASVRQTIISPEQAPTRSETSLELLEGMMDSRRSALVAWGGTADEQSGLTGQEARARLAQRSPERLAGQTPAVMSQPDARSKVVHKPAGDSYADRHHSKRRLINGSVGGLPVGEPDSEPEHYRSDKAETASNNLRRKRQGFVFENSTYGGQRMLVRENLAAHDPCPSDAETVHSAGLRSPKLPSLPQRNKQTTLEAPEIRNDGLDREVSDASSSVYSETSYATEASVQTVRPMQFRQSAQSVSNGHSGSFGSRGVDNVSAPQYSQNTEASNTSMQVTQAQDATHEAHWIQKGLRPSVVSDISVYSSAAHTSEGEEEL